MIGYRKFAAWFIATMVMTIAFFVAIGKVEPTHVASMFQTFVMVQGVLTGAFAGANFGENWAKMKGTGNGK